jgi:hypothetical protein
MGQQDRRALRLLGRIRRPGGRSYKDETGDQNIVCTLYKCTAYNPPERYRVHIANETNPNNPTYRLRPYEEPRHEGEPPNYDEPWYEEDVAKEFPLFAKYLGIFRARKIDPPPRPRR